MQSRIQCFHLISNTGSFKTSPAKFLSSGTLGSTLVCVWVSLSMHFGHNILRASFDCLNAFIFIIPSIIELFRFAMNSKFFWFWSPDSTQSWCTLVWQPKAKFCLNTHGQLYQCLYKQVIIHTDYVTSHSKQQRWWYKQIMKNIKTFDGTNKSKCITWLSQIEATCYSENYFAKEWLHLCYLCWWNFQQQPQTKISRTWS